MRKLSLLVFTFTLAIFAEADHITGGEMYYSYVGFANGRHQYNVMMKLYMRCFSGRTFNNPTIISIFDKGTNARVFDLEVPVSNRETIEITNPDPCISNPPQVCYDIGYYNFTLNLPANSDGYIVAGQVNYRISGIANLSAGYSQIGATYTADIPGVAASPQNAVNNSAHFVGSDLVIVCANNAFSYSFAALDNDNDELTYSFCEAYRSSTGPGGIGGGGTGGNASAPLSPPYQSVPYGENYNGDMPLGSAVSIDEHTGLITGIAPSSGVYVVTVCVTETRNGRTIAVQRKDLQIAIASCNLTSASLLPEYVLCRETKSITLSNLSLSTLIESYNWELSNRNGDVIYNANTPAISYEFADTGTYRVTLEINKQNKCSDSTSALIRVYPGFYPDFDFAGVCINKPTQFFDRSSSVYGTANSWNWNFGVANATNNNTSSPSYTYAVNGTKNVRLIATDTKGCRDTITKPINIVDKPPVLLSFSDTIICVSDKLQLMARGAGTYTWSPDINMINASSPAPTVSPSATTMYYAHLNDQGCLNTDSVLVRVTDHVDLITMSDTTVCAGDPVPLRIISNGLQYAWSPATQLDNPTIANPVAASASSTIYEVTANIGSCVAKKPIRVTAVPYPFANAGDDAIICFGSSIRLLGQGQSNNCRWAPAGNLDDATVLQTTARPIGTTAYILSVFDTQGCPKPGIDTVLITVLPKINAEAKADTSVVVGQQLKLTASGGERYEWWPPTGLSSTSVANPTAVYEAPDDMIVYRIKVHKDNCTDSATVRVKVFATVPTVFVPTGFTPNGDGRNDLLRPIAVGMGKIDHFSIYNRFGQRIFSTTVNGKGWDGRINGQLQGAGTYVWIVSAVDYLGNTFKARGTSVLIR